MSSPDHERFLRRAIELAELASVEYATGGPLGR